MKVLVTGGAGYIGGTLSRILLAQGHEVCIFDNFCHSEVVESLAETHSFRVPIG